MKLAEGHDWDRGFQILLLILTTFLSAVHFLLVPSALAIFSAHFRMLGYCSFNRKPSVIAKEY